MTANRVFWLGIPLFNTLSQIFIKLAAEQVTGSGWAWLWSTATSPWMIAAAAVEAACFVIWIRVLSELDLSKAFPLSAVSYILILAASRFAFGETISPLQLIGSVLILFGVWLISTAGSDALPALAEDPRRVSNPDGQTSPGLRRDAFGRDESEFRPPSPSSRTWPE